MEQLAALCRTRRHMYQSMIRNSYYLPSFKSSLCSLDYMEKVRSGTVHCPRHAEIRLLPCAAPPTKEFLLAELNRVAQKKGLDLGISEKKQPNRDWMLAVLSTMEPTHKIFRKDYVPPLKVQSVQLSKIVDNSDGFFDQLPKLTKKRDLKARSHLKELRVFRKQAQINRLKEHSAKIQTRVAMHTEELGKLQVEQKMIRVGQDDFNKLMDRLSELEDVAGKSSARGKAKKSSGATIVSQSAIPRGDRECWISATCVLPF